MNDSSHVFEDKFSEIFVEWIEFFRPAIAGIDTYFWNGTDQTVFWDILRRGIVIRQFEAMETIRTMVKNECGHFAVVLLRPAYEELTWIRYLNKNADAAKVLVPLLAHYEIATHLMAQNEYAGEKDMETLGFPKKLVQSFLRHDKTTRAEIRKIGQQLGWNTNHTLLPSMAWLSRKVGQEQEYKFLYHGTSRFVHFSAAEIFRRAWGDHTGTLKISSESLSGYWQTFAMYWSIRIFCDLLLAECPDLLPNNVGKVMWEKLDKLDDMMKHGAPFAKVPIITLRELLPFPEQHS